MTNIIGIDVSKYQGSVNWDKVKADPISPQFVYMRGTIGANSLDPKFETYFKEVKRVGLKASMYHLIWPADGFKNEIASIMEQCQSKKFDLPIALDVEQKHGLSNAGLSDYLLDLCKGLQAVNQRFIIYTGAWFWNPNIVANDYWSTIDVWAASYTTKPLVPRDWKTHRIWQKTSSYVMQGIPDNTVDVDEFNGDQSAFDAWIGSGVKPIQHPIGDGTGEPLLGG